MRDSSTGLHLYNDCELLSVCIFLFVLLVKVRICETGNMIVFFPETKVMTAVGTVRKPLAS